MALAGMKLSLDDKDRELLTRLTDVLSELSGELKRYNDGPAVEYAEVISDEVHG